MMRTDLFAIGVLGKVPWKDEYVRVGVQGDTFICFDDWLTTTVDWAAARAGSGWSDAYRRGEVHAFVFRPPGDPKPLLAGAIAPSADGAGRQFPLVIASPVSAPDLARSPEALPILLEQLWEITSAALLEVRAGSPIDFERRFAAVSPEPLLHPSDVLGSYHEWLRVLTLGELWSLVFGEGGASRAGSALRILSEAILPYRNVERPKTPLTLRLPLGAAGGATVCFWIDLVKRIAHWSATIPSFFWSHDGTSGNLLLHLGDPPKSTLAEVWMPARSRDEFCDLTQPGEPGQLHGLRELPELLSRVVLDPDRTVLDLMQAAEHWTPDTSSV